MCPQEQRLVEDSTREVKKVRKARNRRLEWNMMAYDKEFRPDNRFSPSPYHMASSEGSLSPDNRQVLPITRSAHWVSFAFSAFLVVFFFVLGGTHFWLSSVHVGRHQPQQEGFGGKEGVMSPCSCSFRHSTILVPSTIPVPSRVASLTLALG